MNIDLPLILTLAVLITGGIWLFDWLVLSKPRKRALAALDAEYSDARLQEPKERERYRLARDQVEQEPTLIEYSKSFFPVLLLVFVLRSFIAEPFQIPSGSMEPTLEIGDFILVNKFTYGLRLPVINRKVIPVNDPERGDVMVFFPPHQPDIYFIKRVIGIPGDVVEYNNHQLTINGEPVVESSEELLPGAGPQVRQVTEQLGDTEFSVYKNLTPGSFSREGRWTVPEGYYFMMGDNRDSSHDSRGWGMVSEDAIVGKAFAIWMHWDSLFSLPSFERVGRIR
ncbi:signal peptidase I [Marinimicrobium alkaliphilum]|uniref:signal peptidase I n=1 Tax=Marinimicrobium alkaliphilum TaxID=2202654 RepID=UPI000DB98362|nr:signal peptidase I [Marinimicrobium alkaliphilum]